MNTNQIIESINIIVDKKIDLLRADFMKTVKMIEKITAFENDEFLGEFIDDIIKPVKKAKVKSVNRNKTKPYTEGKVKFSKFLLDIFENHPNKDFDLGELGEQLSMGIESGQVTAVSGKIKDEISKRIYQFIKRNDVFRTINGTYQFNPGRKKLNPEID